MALGSAVWAGAPASAAASAAIDATVRVLLFEGSGPLRVARAAAGDESLVAVDAGEGIRVDARPVAAPLRLGGGGSVHLDGVPYRGALEIDRTVSGLRVVNEVSLEGYVAGTVGLEIYSDWPGAALRAQAVAARTYALYRKAQRGTAAYDLDARTTSQVYGGIAAETPEVVRAVAGTRGQYLSYRGRPILAAYHSTSGGRTASAREAWGRPLPYLRSIEVEGEEDSPDTYWHARVSRITLERALHQLGLASGSVRDVRVDERSESGRVRWIRVRGADGAVRVSGRELRAALGETVVKSTKFEIRSAADGIVIVGTGRGHGVGMSQWGARAMALRGASDVEILSTFYPGAELVGGDAR